MQAGRRPPDLRSIAAPATPAEPPEQAADVGRDLASYVAARGPALLRLAWLYTADPQAAQDLVQDALARLVPRWDRLAAGGDPEPYVRAAIRSAWIDRWRWSRRRADLVPVPDLTEVDSSAPDSRLEGTAARLDLDQALARLTPRQRAVLVLRFYEDLTEAQAAAVLGCSINTVKSQARHALQRLRELAPELVSGPEPEVTR